MLFRIVIAILTYHRHKPITLTRWALSGDVMCFLCGTDKPTELSFK
jgi:hypothetical protein